MSYGNAAVLDTPDLESLAEDPETRFLLVDVEGTRRGRELFQALKRAASRKPVLMLKGGMTPEGARAAPPPRISWPGPSGYGRPSSGRRV